MNKIIAVLVLLTAIGGGVYYLGGTSESTTDTYSTKPVSEKETASIPIEERAVIEESTVKVSDDTKNTQGIAVGEFNPATPTEIKDTTDPVKKIIEPKKAGYFLPYSAEEVSGTDSETIVLAFLADWCPSCRAVKSDIQKNISGIPSGMTIFDVDYDEYTSLKKQYGVTVQHTFVQIDASGKAIKTWRGGNTLDSVIAKVN